MEGVLYYKAPGRVILALNKPVTQWVFFETGSMLLWYPQSRRAFRFLQKKPQAIGFASMFLGSIRPDFGLADAGFTLERSAIEDGGLVARWRPPEALEATVGAATIRLRDRKPRSIEIEDRRGRLLARVVYSDYRAYGPTIIPSRVEMTQVQGRESVVEELAYRDMVFDEALPPEIEGFRLPAGVEAEEHEW